MRLTELFVKRPTLVFVALALIALMGSFAWATLIEQEFPNIDFPTVTVSVSYPGASPTELRDTVVRPLEDAIAGAPNLDHINTSIQQNQASISVTFTLDSNQTTDLTEIQNRLQTARSSLPGDLPAPTVRTFDPSQDTIVVFSATSNSMNLPTLSSLLTNTVIPALEQVPGVSFVGSNGTVTAALEVTVDPQKLAASGFTTNDVASAIQSNNVRAPGGIAYLPNRETSIDVRGDIQTPQSIENLLLYGSTAVLSGATSPSGTVTQKFTGSTGATNQALNLGSSLTTQQKLPRVGDVAGVTDSYEAKRVYSYVDGNPAVTLTVQKSSGVSEVAASQAVLAALPSIQAQFPAISLRILNVEADHTKQQLFGVLQTLLEGIVFTGIAMLFFLRSWRNALVVMIAIPASLLVTLFVMRLIGFTIDTVSLLAMTLTIGILVDDSIVVLENIERHYEREQNPVKAAIRGRMEIGSAALVITLVDVVVFLPVAFLPGQTGRFLAEFGFVVTIATLTSLLVSFTITPALAGNWSLLSPWKAPSLITAFSEHFARLRDAYSKRILAYALRRPITVTLLCSVLTIGAIALIPLGFIGFEFIPAVDRGEIITRVQFPTGTPLAVTDAAVRLLSKRFLQLPDVQRITSTSGSAQQSFGGGINLGSNGQLHVYLLQEPTHSTDDVAKMMTRIGNRLVPNARIVAVPATGTHGGNAQPLDITVSATRGEPDAYAPQVLQALTETPGAANVNSSALSLSPQIDITFDRERARVLNADIGSAAQAVRSAFGGTLATQFNTENGTKYVQVLYPTAYQSSLATLRSIALRTRKGTLIHLEDIAILTSAPVEALITRVNRQTVIHIGANLAPGATISSVEKAFLERVHELNLPSSIIVGAAPGGAQQNLTQTVNGLSTALCLSFFLVFLLMVALYDAYRAPLVILFAVPVAAIGAFGALALTHQTLNLYSLIGLIMLVGLVSKNGILLVDHAQLNVRAGLDKMSAITQAAHERFRPIIMTTSSMIAGMMPLALALDPGSAAKRSLGTIVIGGLCSSLVLTLVLVPVMFVWLAPEPTSEPESSQRSNPTVVDASVLGAATRSGL